MGKGVIILLLWNLLLQPKPLLPKPQVIARIEGLPVERAELAREMARYRAQVYVQKTVSESQLKQKAIVALTRIKVEEAALRKYNLWPYRDYSAFLRDWKATNLARNKAVAQGQIVYGPVSYDETDFFDYTFSNAVLKLEQHWHIDDEAYQQLINKRTAVARVTIYPGN